MIFLAFEFPPATGSGVQRSLRHAETLSRFFSLTVISATTETTEDIVSPLTSNNQFSAETIYIKVSQFRSLLERCRWAMRATATAIKKIKALDCDDQKIIYTTSAPFLSHIPGLICKLFYGKKITWFVEYRDLMTRNPTNNLKWKYRIIFPLLYFYEALINLLADKIIIVNHEMKDFLVLGRQKTVVIYNGYDAKKFKSFSKKKVSRKFSIIYSGKVYGERRLDGLLTAIHYWFEQLSWDNQPLVEFTLIGECNPEKIREFKKQFRWFRYQEEVCHTRLLGFLEDASILCLVVEPVPYAETVTTGKLLEYIATRKPILAVVPPDGSADRIITQCNAGKNFDAVDLPGISEYLGSIFQSWQNNGYVCRDESEYLLSYSSHQVSQSLIQLVRAKL